LLVAPDDPCALAQALCRVIGDANERRRFATIARTASGKLPTWHNSAQIFAHAIEALV
jgi:hypothetical protein